MAETIQALNIKITAKDNFSKTLDKLSEKLDKISSKSGSVTTGVAKINNSLNSFSQTSSKIDSSLKNINKSLAKFNNTTATASISLKTFSTSATTTSARVSKLGLNFNTLTKSITSSLIKVYALIGGVRGLANVISSGIASSMEYVETLNLFSVTMGDFADNASQFANYVGDLMGIDPAQWEKYQGTLQAIITGFGVGAEEAAYMSQNLTQLGYDISSFENLDIDQAMLKIQSGLAGEIEPLRRIGYDLSQSRLTEIANDPNNYGNMSFAINELTGAMEGFSESIYDNDTAISVNFDDLTQMEKVQLRYIAMMNEMQFVQSDLSRTLNDPANQTRVLRNQLELCSRAIGNIFIPAVNQLLPYLIATAQVIRDILNEIASLFGYQLPDMSDRTNVSSSVGDYEDIADEMDSAQKSAKKLKDYTLGIDELNVLKPDDSSGSGSGSSASSSGASYNLTGYDFIGDATNNRIEQIKTQIEDLLESVKNGATGIGDYIGELFNKFVEMWKTPFLDGSKFGQSIADALSEASDFFETADFELLGYKLGDWFKGNVQGSDFVYEATRFVIQFTSNVIDFGKGFFEGYDPVNSVDSALKQIVDAMMQPFSDRLYGGHLEGDTWVITCPDLVLSFSTVEYAEEHPIIASLSDYVGDMLGIGDRWDKDGNYIVDVPITVQLDAIWGASTIGWWSNFISGLISGDSDAGYFTVTANVVTNLADQIIGGFREGRRELEQEFSDISNTFRELIQDFKNSIGWDDFSWQPVIDWWTNVWNDLKTGWLVIKGAIDTMLYNFLTGLSSIVGAFGFDTDGIDRVIGYFEGELAEIENAINGVEERRQHNGNLFSGGISQEEMDDYWNRRQAQLIDLWKRNRGENITTPAPRSRRNFGQKNAREYIDEYTEEISKGASRFETAGNNLSDTLAKAIIDGVNESDAVRFAEDFSDNIRKNSTIFSNSGKNVSATFTSGFLGDINSKKTLFANSGVELSNNLTKGISDGIYTSKGIVNNAVEVMKNDMITSLNNGLYSRFNSTTANGLKGLTDAIETSKGAVYSGANSLKNTLISGASDGLYNSMYGSAEYATSGFAKAIVESNAYKQVIDNAKQLARDSVNAVRTELQIHSPSRVFEQLGEYTVEGFNIGFESEAENTYKTLTNFASTVAGVDVSMAYKPTTSGYVPQATTTAVTGSQTESMSNMAMLVYEAVNTALQGNRAEPTPQGDTKIYINGKEIFKVVQEESRRNGVAISNGAFVGG